MKKFLILIIFSLLLSNSVHANSNEKIKKDGFVTPTINWKDKIKIDESFEVSNPKDKIIIIYNHGSDGADVKLKDCFWRSELRNWAQLAGDKINDKEFIVSSTIEKEKFEEFFSHELNCPDVESLGGFVLKEFGHLPKVGEKIEVGNLEMTITSADQTKN